MKSTIAAFLMSIPLSAIGLMAVFGIPQMAPGSLLQKGLGQGSAQEDDVLRGDYFEDDEEAPASRRRRSRSSGRSEAEASAPAFDEADSSDRSEVASRSGRGPAWNDRNEETSAEGGVNPFASRTRTSPPGREDSFDTAEAEMPRERITNPRTNLTWKSARNRLTELGVTHFHLERGSTDDSFLFVCMFSPGDDPRVTRRFEAEAPEPLAAVDGVLGQIDTWMQRRFASQSAVGFNR